MVVCSAGNYSARRRAGWTLRGAAPIVFALIFSACAPSGTAPPPIVGVPASPPAAGLVAPLRAIGSALVGKVRVIDRGDGVSVMLAANNILQGPYRLAFHQNGNCSSPNAFSAGPAWSPAGRNPAELIPPLFQKNDGATNVEVHVSGVRTTGENGVAGRSILLYAGDTIYELQPGVRNNVLACGVFEPAVPVF
jgi:Cu-Zn family superoxide dismutase